MHWYFNQSLWIQSTHLWTLPYSIFNHTRRKIIDVTTCSLSLVKRLAWAEQTQGKYRRRKTLHSCFYVQSSPWKTAVLSVEEKRPWLLHMLLLPRTAAFTSTLTQHCKLQNSQARELGTRTSGQNPRALSANHFWPVRTSQIFLSFTWLPDGKIMKFRHVFKTVNKMTSLRPSTLFPDGNRNRVPASKEMKSSPLLTTLSDGIRWKLGLYWRH